jgi:phospholipase C
MTRRILARQLCDIAIATTTALSLVGSQSVAFAQPDAERETRTPIKHVIVIIGENRTFDHVFATYKPVDKNETVWNLLSKGIVKPDGAPGPNYAEALQYSATDNTTWRMAPTKAAYATLPPAMVGGPSTPQVCAALGATTGTSCDTPANEQQAKAIENGLADGYYQYMLTGGTGQPSHQPDQRIAYDGQGPTTLPPGPFQLTSANLPYDAYAASPVHRFYQPAYTG